MINEIIHSQSSCLFDPSIYQAAKQGNLDKVQAFIRNGGWIDMPNKKGNSMLYYGCKAGQVEVVRYLLGQGAHSYSNLKGKTGLERALQEIKNIVKENEVLRKEISVLAYTLNHQIVEKALKLRSMECGVPFILSIVIPQERKKALESYVLQAVCEYDHPILILQLVKDPFNQAIVARALVHSFLSCGDIESARHVLDFLPPKMALKSTLAMSIAIFTEKFEGIEIAMQANPSQFQEMIKFGVELQNVYSKCPEEDIKKIIYGMYRAGSFAKAFEYANGLSSKYRGFAKSCLTACGLSALAEDLENDVAEKLKDLAHQTIQQMREIHDLAVFNKDFSKVLEFIDTIENETLKTYMKIEISLQMCIGELYEESFDLLKTHLYDLEEIDHIILEFTTLLKMKSEEYWFTKFAALKIEE